MADQRDERDEWTERGPTDSVTDERRPYAPRNNTQQGPGHDESVVADDDLAMRGAGAAGGSAGSGVPGLGGSPGGTPNSGGVGLPGGHRKLGAGQATSPDAGLGGTVASGGLGTGGNARSGRGNTPSSEVLSGGVTRQSGSPQDATGHGPSVAEHETLRRADQSALQSGAMMNNRSGSAAANNIPTHGDEAATRMRKSLGAQSRPLPTGPDTPVPDAPQYDADTPTWNAGSRSTSENPIPKQPSPGLMDRPGPEAET